MPVDVDNFTKVNLDVTTLIALVSELTHGGCWYEFPEPLIRELAEQERLHPLLPELNSFLQGMCVYLVMKVCDRGSILR